MSYIRVCAGIRVTKFVFGFAKVNKYIAVKVSTTFGICFTSFFLESVKHETFSLATLKNNLTIYVMNIVFCKFGQYCFLVMKLRLYCNVPIVRKKTLTFLHFAFRKTPFLLTLVCYQAFRNRKTTISRGLKIK